MNITNSDAIRSSSRDTDDLLSFFRRSPVGGISEWECIFFLRAQGMPWPEHPIDDCIEAHLAVGMKYIVWNCGRSTVDYQSALPGANPYGVGTPPSGSWAEYRHAMIRRYCPLRRAIECCRREGMPILGRLTMNRHYGLAKTPDLVGPLAAGHPEFHERDKTGEPVPSRLCYAIEEVQRERLDILLEVQRLGVDALVPDFCRQPPMLMYHPALVEPFMKKTGCDPRKIDSGKPEDYREWFQYRADVMTGFVHRLREEVRRQERELGRPCPIIARIPDNAPWLNVAYGIDSARWLAEDLVDGTMLSPFPLSVEDEGRFHEHHIAEAHRYGKPCIGGLGSFNLMREGATVNQMVANHRQWFFPRPAHELVHRQLQDGADGVSVYQSESLVRLPYLQELLRDIADKEAAARRLKTLPELVLPPEHFVGIDWHSSWLGKDGAHGQLLGLKSPKAGAAWWRML